jgi:hypothetical protein
MTKPLLMIGAAAGVILVVLILGGAFNWVRSHRPMSARELFVPDFNNDKMITVRGWQPEQIDSLLQEFADRHGEVFVDIGPGSTAGASLLTFPRDIRSDQFLFLVSFLTHPVGHDAPGSLAVIGKVTLTDAFKLPDRSLRRKRAFVYVPEGDVDRGRVYVEVVSAGVYVVSPRNVRWRPAESPHQPSWLHQL